MNLLIPNHVEKALEMLNKNEYKAYVVGGAVRDAILGFSPDDWDITTNASVEKMRLIFPKYFETGVKHGTLTVLIDKKAIEITTFRIDGEYKDNRKPKNVEFTDSLEEDVKRRDFTINAICYNKHDGIIDYTGGINDIKNHIIRCVGNPEKRFNEDALRILRAIRFSSCLEFEIEAETKKAIIAKKELLKNISAERINSELTKLLLKGKSITNLSLISDVVFNNLSKHLKSKKYCEDIINIKSDISLKYAALLYVCNIFYARDFLNKYRFSNKDKNEILTIIENKDLHLCENELAARRLLNKFSADIIIKIYEFQSVIKCIDTTKSIGYIKKVTDENQPYSLQHLKINGTDILNMGIKKEKISTVLSYILSKVIENPQLNDKNTLIKIAKDNFLCQ